MPLQEAIKKKRSSLWSRSPAYSMDELAEQRRRTEIIIARMKRDGHFDSLRRQLRKSYEAEFEALAPKFDKFAKDFAGRYSLDTPDEQVLAMLRTEISSTSRPYITEIVERHSNNVRFRQAIADKMSVIVDEEFPVPPREPSWPDDETPADAMQALLREHAHLLSPEDRMRAGIVDNHQAPVAPQPPPMPRAPPPQVEGVSQAELLRQSEAHRFAAMMLAQRGMAMPPPNFMVPPPNFPPLSMPPPGYMSYVVPPPPPMSRAGISTASVGGESQLSKLVGNFVRSVTVDHARRQPPPPPSTEYGVNSDIPLPPPALGGVSATVMGAHGGIGSADVGTSGAAVVPPSHIVPTTSQHTGPEMFYNVQQPNLPPFAETLESEIETPAVQHANLQQQQQNLPTDDEDMEISEEV